MPRASRSLNVSAPSSGVNGRLQALTGMRFYAALMVVGFHLVTLNNAFISNSTVVEPIRFALRNGGWFGVTFFFVLSGFVLTWSAREKDNPFQFFTRRFAKVVPNHVVTFLIAFAVAGLGAASTWEAGANLFLLHAWIPSDTSFFSINHPSWSLSAEMFFYLAFPFVIPWARRVPAQRILPIIGIVAVVLLLLPLLISLLPAGELFGPNHARSPLHGASITQVWAVYALPLVRFGDFFIGILLARGVIHGVIPNIGIPAATVSVLATYAVSLFVPLPWQLDSLYVLPVAALIAAAATTESTPRWLSGPRAVRLGEMSFALYMVHDIVLTITARLTGDESLSIGAGISISLLVLAASLGCAWLLWRFVENPANRYLRGILTRSQIPAVTTPERASK